MYICATDSPAKTCESQCGLKCGIIFRAACRFTFMSLSWYHHPRIIVRDIKTIAARMNIHITITRNVLFSVASVIINSNRGRRKDFFLPLSALCWYPWKMDANLDTASAGVTREPRNVGHIAIYHNNYSYRQKSKYSETRGAHLTTEIAFYVLRPDIQSDISLSPKSLQ